ncbi:MAG: GAF domain-containing protein [Desulfohalobiaceae bacterium]|nr:GAF domain-containing protein [Desulfohalobiaceae bacterium]
MISWNLKSKLVAGRIALLYILLAGLWIVFSDQALEYFVTDKGLLTLLQTYKGWLFVVATGLILYIVLRHRIQKLFESENALQEDESNKLILYEFSSRMRSAQNSNDLMAMVLDNTCGLYQADHAVITLLSDDRQKFSIALARGIWKNSQGLTFPSNTGLSGQVLQAGEAYTSKDYGSEPWSVALGSGEENRLGPAIAVPLTSDGELKGVLTVARDRSLNGRPFSQSEVNLLATVGEMVGLALHRISLFEDAQRSLRQIQALRNIDMAITSSLDLRVTYKVIMDEVVHQLQVDACAILQRRPESQMFEYEAWRGFSRPSLKEFSRPLSEGILGRVVNERCSLYISNKDEIESDAIVQEIMKTEGLVDYYAVPLVVKGRVRGILELFHRKRVKRDRDWENFMDTLAGQAAVAIDNADMFRSLEQTNLDLLQAYDATLEGWAYALGLKEDETAEHSKRVTGMTVKVAREMGVKNENLSHVRRGALLHDIGKMGIPDSILLKQGKLTEEEFEVMKRHPVYAFKMLSRIDYLRPALDIPFCHHEKWDGSGYPQGLQGDEIPLAARVFAVVDVWDALGSDRPYRKAWPLEQVIAYIQGQSGKHFDSLVVEQFLKVLSRKEAGIREDKAELVEHN